MARKKKKRDSRGQGQEVQDDDSLPSTAVRTSSTAKSKTAAKAQSLESRFAKLTSTARENLDLIAAYTPLTRPISSSLAILHPDRIDGQEKEALQSFRLPKKPRWHRELNSKAVQSNEESTFLHWLQATDELMDSRFSLIKEILNRPVEDIQVKNLPRPAPGQCLLPSMFERNVQVYRQLWRVMERSHLLLVLLDARCPLLHLPESLVDHLRKYASLKTILVLTKKDIVGEEIAHSWKEWLEKRFGWPVVVTESYKRQERREGQGKRTRLTPFLSDDSRSAIFAAIKKAHGLLTTPPSKIAQDPEKLAQWRPSCATDIDWEQVEHGSSSEQDDTVTNKEGEAEEADGIQNSVQDSLCIGLIGQPNVGKSSLLNALMGSKVVHASRTPGKTKIFQTHYLGYGHEESLTNSNTTSNGSSSSSSSSNSSKSKRRSRVLLCDCPGLIFPSSAGQELQVLGAILPISQVQSFSSIVRFLGSIMPLEDVLDLRFPPDEEQTITPTFTANGKEEVEKEWTAHLILEALCRRYGYRTAKAGRWDVNRAGNALIRSIAEGRIRWAFHPPVQRHSPTDDDNDGDEDVEKDNEEISSRRIHSQLKDGRGIWLPDLLSRNANSVHPSSHFLEGEDSYHDDYDDDDFDEEEEEEERGKDKLESSTTKCEKEEEGRVQRTKDRSVKRVTFELSEQKDVDRDDTDEEEEEEEEVVGSTRCTSLFGALTVEGDDEDDEEDDKEE